MSLCDLKKNFAKYTLTDSKRNEYWNYFVLVLSVCSVAERDKTSLDCLDSICEYHSSVSDYHKDLRTLLPCIMRSSMSHLWF